MGLALGFNLKRKGASPPVSFLHRTACAVPPKMIAIGLTPFLSRIPHNRRYPNAEDGLPCSTFRLTTFVQLNHRHKPAAKNADLRNSLTRRVRASEFLHQA